MKTAPKFATLAAANNLVRMPIALTLIIASVVTLWFATAPRAEAAIVQICHKKVLTLNVVLNSLDYRRHKDHGDTDGACGATTSNQFLSANKLVKPLAPKPGTQF